MKLDWYQQEDHENPEVTDMYIGRTIFVDSKSANEKWKLFLPGSTTEEWCALYSIHGIGHLSHPKTRHDGNALDEFGIFGGFMSPGSGIAALVSGDWFQDKYAIRGDPDCFKVIGKQIPTVDSLVIGRKVRVSKHYPECNIWADSNETMKEEICKFLAK